MLTAAGGQASATRDVGWSACCVLDGALAATKWNGLFDFFVVWLSRRRRRARSASCGGRRSSAIPSACRSIVIVGGMLVRGGDDLLRCATFPFFTLGHNFSDMVALQTADVLATTMTLEATASLITRTLVLVAVADPRARRSPISITISAPGRRRTTRRACCVAEILALPNPFVWWFGLLTVPRSACTLGSSATGLRAADRRRTSSSGCPGSARRASRSSTISSRTWRSSCLANAIVLQTLWNWARPAVDRADAAAHRRRRLLCRSSLWGVRVLLSDPGRHRTSPGTPGTRGCGSAEPGSFGARLKRGDPMSGHCKWHNIKLKKGKVDAQRGALFTKLQQRDHPRRERRLGGSRGQLPAEDGGREGAREQHAAGQHQARDRARLGGADSEKQIEEIRYEGYGPAGWR